MVVSPLVRPWHGTALGVIDIIATVFSFLFGLLFLMFQGLLNSFFGEATGTMMVNGVQVEGVEAAEALETVEGILPLLASLGIVVGVVLLGFGVLGIFMAKGAFKGQKWSPIVSIVFSALALVGILASFSNSQLFSLALNAFILYVAVMCVKNPYFKKVT